MMIKQYLSMFVPPKELTKQYFGSCISTDLRPVLFCKSKGHIIRVIKEVRYGIGKSKQILAYIYKSWKFSFLDNVRAGS